MPVVKVQRNEMERVKAAAERVAHRTNSRFVLDPNRVEITDEIDQNGSEPVDVSTVSFK